MAVTKNIFAAVVAVLVIVAIAVLESVGWSPTGFPQNSIAPIVATCAAFLVGVFSLLACWNGTTRQRILGLATLYICILSLFGAVYHVVHLVSPTSAFAFSQSVHEGRANETHDTASRAVRAGNEKLYAISVLDANPAIAMQAIKEHGIPVGDPDGPITAEYSCTISRYSGSATLRLTINRHHVVIGGGHIRHSPETAAVAGLDLTEDIPSLHSNINRLANTIENARNDLIRETSNNFRESSQFVYTDFLYFSAVTITTLGYGDIVPNSSIVRLIVIVQTLTGVFFLAFALNTLWPNESKAHRSQIAAESDATE